MNCAPIALFAYNRPWHLRQTVDALMKNELAGESDLIIFSDAPRDPGADEAVREVRTYLKNITGFRSVTIIKRTKNFGLANSIIDGVTRLCTEYGRIIVVEDDLVTSPYFLRYMNESLDMYEQEEQVISIHGYMYPVEELLPVTFFVRGADCWGWATWKRGWDLFEPDAGKLLSVLAKQNLKRRFDLNGAYSYSRMLEDQVSGKIDSWAVRWHASAFVKGKLTLYPVRSLVRNIGFDSSGTHCGTSKNWDTDLATSPILVEKISVQEHLTATNAIENYWRSVKPSWMNRISRRIFNLLI